MERIGIIKARQRVEHIDRMLGETAKFSPSWSRLMKEKQELLDKLRNNKR